MPNVRERSELVKRIDLHVFHFAQALYNSTGETRWLSLAAPYKGARYETKVKPRTLSQGSLF